VTHACINSNAMPEKCIFGKILEKVKINNKIKKFMENSKNIK
jgi:hypothetical protein